MKNQQRHPLATLSVFGVSLLHRQNPNMVAWWSAAYPGFGQYLLNHYVRGTLLTLFEVITNTLAKVNEALVFSFSGNFEMAKSILQPRWAYGYFIIYIYSIWDSYRGTVFQNKMCQLAELENDRLCGTILHPLEIQYLELKNPFIAVFYSFLFPGLGQLYNHRFGLGFWAMIWWWIFLALSHAYESIFYLFIGEIQQSIAILHPHWLLFMPSVLGGSVYHAFVTTIEHNRLYCREQRQHLQEQYQNSKVHIFP